MKISKLYTTILKCAFYSFNWIIITKNKLSMHKNMYGLFHCNFKLLHCSYGVCLFLFLFKTTNNLITNFSVY